MFGAPYLQRNGSRKFTGRKSASGVDAVEGAGEGDGFADVVEAADPGDDALNAHTEAAMRDGAVAAEIQIPLEGGDGESVLLDAGEEEIVVVHALRASDDLAITFWG
jgi:hypothetical protein